jgi:hypothetical protein
MPGPTHSILTQFVTPERRITVQRCVETVKTRFGGIVGENDGLSPVEDGRCRARCTYAKECGDRMRTDCMDHNAGYRDDGGN